MTVPSLTGDDYANMLQQLLPPGPIWSDADALNDSAAFIAGTFDKLSQGRQIARVASGDLVPTDLSDLISISLFSWRRATDDDPVREGASRRGWWADATLGSRLWLLAGKALTRSAVTSAARYCEEALAWLVTERIAASVSVETERQGGRLAIAVLVTRPRDPRTVERYPFIWSV